MRQGLEEMRQALPFLLQGIGSDNGSELTTDHLVRYCQAQQIQFTRGRPCKKDDNAQPPPDRVTERSPQTGLILRGKETDGVSQLRTTRELIARSRPKAASMKPV